MSTLLTLHSPQPRATQLLLGLPPANGALEFSSATFIPLQEVHARAQARGRGPVQPTFRPQVRLPKTAHQRQNVCLPLPRASHLCPCLWGAFPSPGRARGCCTSVSPGGSPSSWPLSLQLWSRAGAGGLGGLGLCISPGKRTWAQDSSGQMVVVGLGRVPSGNWGPIPGGRDAWNAAPPHTPSGNPPH